ncbi:muscarinic acetylcholine receptor M1-like [Astyanax mexicanus]|uniref:Muscarinic acetylcholine receptor n=2 Tax=Astyanax mexicanus TaxID=7994 RepID=A0A8T2LRK8_ASTMX|nr:muscarinic acetylcholine receptor M1-like [Astyanax mexicanus]
MMNATTASFTLSNVTNDTAEPAGGPITWRMAMITLITVPLSVITIIGNILVIISFRVNPLLRTVSNYFLLSLAVADLILGTISMNLYTTYILLGRWTLGNLACDVWLAVDYVASNASVMNLLAISFDRYLSVTRPLTYRASRTTKRAALMISLAWGVSFILWAPAILFWQHIVGERTVAEDQCSIQFLSEPVITFGTAIAAFYLPVCVMVALYWKVYRETEKRSQQLAGLMASRGGDTKKSSLRSSDQQLQPGLEGTVQPNPEPRSLCPSITHCTAAWWKKKRESYIRPPSHTAPTTSHPQTDANGSLSNKDEEKFTAYIPLVRINKKLDSVNCDSDMDSDVHVADCQSDSQQSVGSCQSEDTPGSSLSQTRAQRSRKPRSWSLVREKKAARTLSAILLAFIVTWTPYNIMVLVSTFCDDCVPEGLWQLGYWLCYVNSTVNPVCYALCNKQFRVTFKALLLCRWKELRRGTRWAMSRGS